MYANIFDVSENMEARAKVTGINKVVVYAGFEPATSPLSGVRSNQLS